MKEVYLFNADELIEDVTYILIEDTVVGLDWLGVTKIYANTNLIVKNDLIEFFLEDRRFTIKRDAFPCKKKVFSVNSKVLLARKAEVLKELKNLIYAQALGIPQ